MKLAQCISITDPRHLYLTNDLIPTHNTHACICWLFEQAWITGSEGRNFWWVAPVYPQAEIAWRRMKRALPSFVVRSVTATPLKIELINGAILYFRSAEKPDNLYGEDVYAAVIDEASRCRQESWFAIRSTLTATRGPMRAIGNVKGRRNWFYDLSRRAQSGEPGMAWYRMNAYDAVDGGVLAIEEVEDAKRQLPEDVFRELYLAEPSDDGGNPFGIQFIARCVTPMTSNPPVAIGVDLAKYQDWTVIIALDRDGNVCGFERFRKDWEAIGDRVMDLIGTTPALIDATGVGDPIAERVMKKCRRAEGFVFTAKTKQAIMEGLALSIQRQEIGFPEGTIRQELEDFEYVATRTAVRYSAPEGYHDDAVCALALANEMRRRNPAIGRIGPKGGSRISPWLGATDFGT